MLVALFVTYCLVLVPMCCVILRQLRPYMRTASQNSTCSFSLHRVLLDKFVLVGDFSEEVSCLELLALSLLFLTLLLPIELGTTFEVWESLS